MGNGHLATAAGLESNMIAPGGARGDQVQGRMRRQSPVKKAPALLLDFDKRNFPALHRGFAHQN